MISTFSLTYKKSVDWFGLVMHCVQKRIKSFITVLCIA